MSNKLNELTKKVESIVRDETAFSNLLLTVGNTLNRSIEGARFRKPGFYEIYKYDELYVFGDLHGDIESLHRLISDLNLLDKLDEKDVKIVFLGDYIDRGDRQIEVLTTLLLLKVEYSDKVIMLRGNHEFPPIVPVYPHDFPEHLISKYGDKGKELYRLVTKVFQKLPYGARVLNELLLIHGGPPVSVLTTKSFEEAFSIGNYCVDDGVLEEVLWNDPSEVATYTPSYRGAGYFFGYKVTEKTLQLANVKFIVRSHEPTIGFKVDHNGRVITIFSSVNVYGTLKISYVYLRREEAIDSYEDLVFTI